MPKHPYHNAFTLLELSIVLVISAFIVAGILVGQDMIRKSNLDGAAVDVQRYIAASQRFINQYNGIPGDYANTLVFPQPTTAATCDGVTANTLPNQTCAGNGNGTIESAGATYYLPSGSTATSTEAEELLFWQHLQVTGFIQGSFTGVGTNSTTDGHTPGTNSPPTRVEGGYGIAYLGVISASGSSTSTYTTTDFFNGTYNHVIFMGAINSGTIPDLPLISASEALAVDKKFDDGLPASGNIFTAVYGSLLWSYPTGHGSMCATTNVASTAQYNVTTTAANCALGFVTGF